MNATDYLDALSVLRTASLDDPLLRLAHAVAWLDPVCVYSDTYPDEDEYADENDLQAGLLITRHCFPAIYTDAVMSLHTGHSEKQVEQTLRDGIGASGIPMDTIEFEGAFAYGIPMPAHGIELNDLYSLEPYQGQIESLYALFGIHIDYDEYDVDIPPDVDDVAMVVAFSLTDELRQRYPVYERLYWLLGWAFSMTGNSSIDYTWETMAELQPLEWLPDHVELAQLIIQESDEIMDAALTGLAEFQTNNFLREALTHNITIVRERLSQEHRRVRDLVTDEQPNPFALNWPAIKE